MTREIAGKFRSLTGKIFLLIGRGILKNIDNSTKTQTIQVTALDGEVITGVERLQDFGFESFPPIEDTEVLLVFPNGNRDNGIAIRLHNREKRPKTLNPGESIMYDSDGNTILLKNGNVIEIKTGPTALEKTILGETLKSWLSTHTHPTPSGPSGPPVEQATLAFILSPGVNNN